MAQPRIRLRTDYPVKGICSWDWSPGYETGHWQQELSNYNISSYMIDASEKKRTVKGSVPYPKHPCLHIKHKVTQNASSITWLDWNHVVEHVHRAFAPWELDSLFQWPPEDAVAGPAGRAFDAFSTQIPTEISIANFLYELKDLKGLIPSLREGALKAANNGFLSYQLGLKPFLNDLKNLRNLLGNLDKRLKWLRKNFGKPVSIHSRSDDIWTHPPVDPRGQVGDISTTVLPPPIWWVLESYKADYTATGILTQRLEGLDDSLTFLKSLAAALGLYNPAAIVWEGIPYSFVVDWFFRLDDWISGLQLKPFKGAWDVTGVTNSVTVKLRTSGWYRGNMPTIDGVLRSNPWVKLYTVDINWYQRWLGLNLKRTALSDLSPDQQKLLGSLIFQRIL